MSEIDSQTMPLGNNRYLLYIDIQINTHKDKEQAYDEAEKVKEMLEKKSGVRPIVFHHMAVYSVLNFPGQLFYLKKTVR